MVAKNLSNLLGTISDAHIIHKDNSIYKLQRLDPTGTRIASFDIKSLFTKAPIRDFLHYLKTYFTNVAFHLPIPVPNLIYLIENCLVNS